MNARSLDAIVYPTIRTVPNTIGETQRGSNCQLSAHTGLPALSVPAGLSRGLPVGMELMGRPFQDARLLALGYAFERANDHRQPPASTPPLVEGLAPTTVVVDVRARSEGAEARAHFEYDALRGALGFDVQVRGVPAEDIYAVVLRHADEEGRWYVARRLTGPGVVSDAGTLDLNAAMRTRLEAGELYLELVTRGDPVRFARAQVLLER